MADRSQFVSSLKRLPGLAGWQVEEVGVEEARSRAAGWMWHGTSTRVCLPTCRISHVPFCQSASCGRLLNPQLRMSPTQAEGWVLGRRHLRSTREVEMLPGNRTREGASVIVGGGEPGT